MPNRRVAFVWGVALLLGAGSSSRAAEPGPLSFEKDVRPIFKAYCFDCHGGEATKANLDLRLKRFAVTGGDGGEHEHLRDRGDDDGEGEELTVRAPPGPAFRVFREGLD